MVRIVGNHASARQEVMACAIRKQPGTPSPRQTFIRHAKRITCGGAEQRADESFAFQFVASSSGTISRAFAAAVVNTSSVPELNSR